MNTEDQDVATLSRDQLVAEVRKLRAGIRQHRDASGHDLCWHQPALWSLLPERTDPLPAGDDVAAATVVEQFWALMATNDFGAVGAVLAEDYVLEWPQSGERIRGRANFAAMNAAYPAAGRWAFDVHRIVGGDGQAVSDVTVTDGVRRDRSIAFFSIAYGKILRQVEFWPEPYPAPPERRQFVEPLQ